MEATAEQLDFGPDGEIYGIHFLRDGIKPIDRLELGALNAGATTEGEKIVIRSELSGVVEAFEIELIPTTDDARVEFSLEVFPFIPAEFPLVVHGPFEKGDDVITLYMRAALDKDDEGTKSVRLKVREVAL